MTDVDILTVKYLHILSSTLLFGTGIGTAFYLLTVSWTRDARTVAVVARLVVIADWIFTATTIVFQPLTYLSRRLMHPFGDARAVLSLVRYVIAARCWMPVSAQ